MNTRALRLARWIVVSGYALIAVGAVIDFVWLGTTHQLDLGVKNFVASIASPLAALGGVVAWWFLTKIISADVGQLPFVRRAFAGLSIQATFLAVSYLLVSLSDPSLQWPYVAVWGYSVGTTLSAIGFLLMTWCYYRNTRATTWSVASE